MRPHHLALSFIVLLFSLSCLSQDSLFHAVDGVADTPDNCLDVFLQRAGLMSAAPGGISLITKPPKTVTLNAFLKTIESTTPAHAVTIDLDGDGKKELVITNYTGGAHCCDEIYFFKNIQGNKYQLTGKLFAGNTCIGDDNIITYDLYEQFGYFFTCYACSYPDSSETAPEEVQSIQLRYKNGKLNVIPGDQELRHLVLDNLGKLSERPFQPLDNDAAQDDGIRKAFALNLAVYHFSFGRNLVATKKIFDSYYKFPDAKKLWLAFTKILATIPNESSF
jgi:hypothetical protein